MDTVAEALGMDPLDFRLRNHVPPEGQPGVRTTPKDQIVDVQPVEGGVPFSSNGLREKRCIVPEMRLYNLLGLLQLQGKCLLAGC